jgi:hypothetical protein
VLFLFALQVAAQSDCNTATSVCNAVYDENNSPTGTGANSLELPFGSCNASEVSSAWYIFSPQADGLFGFILEPQDNADDYDNDKDDIEDSIEDDDDNYYYNNDNQIDLFTFFNDEYFKDKHDN